MSSCSKRTVAPEGITTYNELYKVKKIKKVNDWYFIYFHRNDSVFKVISREPTDTKDFEKYPKIKKRGRYDLTLISFEDYVNGMWVPGFLGNIMLPGKTPVRLEPENDIYMIYLTPDLKGLYYQKNINYETEN